MTERNGAIELDPAVRLTVRGCAWAYLSSTLDPQRDALVFVWGSSGAQSAERWSASVFPRAELPLETDCRLIETRLGLLEIAVPQRQHLDKLDGCTLSHEASALIVS